MILTEIRNGTLALVVLLGVAVALLQAPSVGVPRPSPSYEEETLTLTVAFRPTWRHEPVVVRYNADGRYHGPFEQHNSPWSETVIVRRGSRVTLSATQEESGRVIDCLIFSVSDGRLVDQNTRDTQGSIRCYHNRR